MLLHGLRGSVRLLLQLLQLLGVVVGLCWAVAALGGVGAYRGRGLAGELRRRLLCTGRILLGWPQVLSTVLWGGRWLSLSLLRTFCGIR